MYQEVVRKVKVKKEDETDNLLPGVHTHMQDYNELH